MFYLFFIHIFTKHIYQLTILLWFLSHSTTAIFTFIFVTSIMYIPTLLFNRDTFILEKRKRVNNLLK